MIGFRYIGNISMKERISGTSDTITFPNSEIANFFREIQLTINIIRGIQDQYLIDAVLPDTLRVYDAERPSYVDCTVLIDVLREMMRYTEENKHQLETFNKDLIELVRTTISIDDGDLSITTLNTAFDKDIRKFCQSKGYKI